MSPRNDRGEKREQVIRDVLSLLLARSRVSVVPNGVAEMSRAEDRVDLGCLAVARAVDALPVPSRPKGWTAGPETARIADALPAEPYPTRTFRAAPTSVQGPGMTEPVLYLPEGEQRCGWSEGCVNGPAAHPWHPTCQEHPEVGE